MELEFEKVTREQKAVTAILLTEDNIKLVAEWLGDDGELVDLNKLFPSYAKTVGNWSITVRCRNNKNIVEKTAAHIGDFIVFQENEKKSRYEIWPKKVFWGEHRPHTPNEKEILDKLSSLVHAAMSEEPSNAEELAPKYVDMIFKLFG